MKLYMYTYMYIHTNIHVYIYMYIYTEWAAINIVSAAKYLGFYIGPEAAAAQWRKAVAKYLAQSVQIGRSGVPASLATHKYNQNAASVLMYLAQLAPLPKNFNQTERTGLFTIYHLATNSMTLPTLVRLRGAGGPSPTNVAAAAKACMFRMAAKTCSCWQSWMVQLRSNAQVNGTLLMVARGELSSTLWDCGTPSHFPKLWRMLGSVSPRIPSGPQREQNYSTSIEMVCSQWFRTLA